MSIVDDSGIQQLAKHVGHLYLNKDFSDVTIVVDGVNLPAHRNILAQRSSYFKAMFTSGMIESTSKRVELRETPINAFKIVLKWIYTGVIEFDGISNALEVLDLAHMYELLELEKITVDYLESISDSGNACLLLNSALRLSITKLKEVAEHYFDYYISDILADKTFESLSKEAVDYISKEPSYDVTNIEILQAFVRWMKSNADKSEHFPELLKNISLNSINFGDLLSIIPSDLFTANVLADIAREQQLNYEKGLVGIDVVRLGFGIKVIHGGDTSFFNPYSDIGSLQHTIGDSHGIVVDLGQRFLLNSLEVSPCSGTQNSYEISVSVDNKNWATVAKHSYSIDDNGYHDFRFPERIARFIRIRGTSSQTGTFAMDVLEASYVD